MVFKSESSISEFVLLENSGLDPSKGMCSFKVTQNKYQDLRKMYLNGESLFYITTMNEGVRSVLYTGLFIPSDLIKQDPSGIDNTNVSGLVDNSKIIDDPNIKQETAIVTRKKVITNIPPTKKTQ